MGEIVPDGGLQFPDASERATPNAAVGKQTKKPFDLIQPTGAGGREVHMVAGTAREPALHLSICSGATGEHPSGNRRGAQ